MPEDTAKTIKKMRGSFNMTRQRCLNPKCRDYPYYGGRGIKICDRWLESFDNFLEDMGLRPPGMTLERKDNDGPYSKENCVWANRKTQSSNTRSVKKITWNGETHNLSEWERILGFKQGTLKARLSYCGYSIDEAMTKPVKCGEKLPGRQYKKRRPTDPSKIRSGQTSKLTKFRGNKLMALRRQYRTGKHTFSSLARLHGVTVTTVSNAVQGINSYKDTCNA